MVLDAAGFDACAGQAFGDIDQDAGLVCADLVNEDGWCVGEDDVTVIGHGELGVDEFEAPEFTLDLGLSLNVVFPEFRCIAVCYQRHGAEVVVLLTRSLALYAQHLVRVVALDDACDGGLNDCDVWCGLCLRAQFRYEAAVVK